MLKYKFNLVFHCTHYPAIFKLYHLYHILYAQKFKPVENLGPFSTCSVLRMKKDCHKNSNTPIYDAVHGITKIVSSSELGVHNGSFKRCYGIYFAMTGIFIVMYFANGNNLCS